MWEHHNRGGCHLITGDNAEQQQSGVLLRFPTQAARTVKFDHQELALILNLYGHNVASGDWRDYAMDFGRDRAVFCIFRRSSEQPLYRIIKDPSLARKHGVYSVIAQTGLILKRGHDLAQVLQVLVKKPKLGEA
jgi:hypothetical protein